MPNYENIIFSSAQYKITLLVNNVPFPVFTSESFSSDIRKENEAIHAIGQEEPIGTMNNAKSYSGRLSMQLGEHSAMLTTLGLTDGTEISNAQLAIFTYNGIVSRIYSGIKITAESFDIRRKEKESLVNLDWTAVSVTA